MKRSVSDHTSRLRGWREAEGLTLPEVAALTGVSVAMLSRVERGKRQMRPKAKVMFARCLGVPLRELFEPEPYEEAVAV